MSPLLWLLLLGQHAPGALTPGRAASAETTRCAACHTTASWTQVSFNHERTGFSLTGEHTRASCKTCHPVSFTQPRPRACAGCHQDVHAQELGARCEGCHDTRSWRPTFDADAHRRTNFPLLGGHAALPCVECHLEAKERRFSRAAVDCGGCHAGDFTRTQGTAVDHAALGFSPQACRQCHGAFRFRPAVFPGHDACFVTSAGAHAGITCQGCHTSLATAATPGTCSTRTAACTACHAHQCSVGGGQTATDAQHANVAGYQCRDRKCYECHQHGAATP